MVVIGFHLIAAICELFHTPRIIFPLGFARDLAKGGCAAGSQHGTPMWLGWLGEVGQKPTGRQGVLTTPSIAFSPSARLIGGQWPSRLVATAEEDRLSAQF
jgi:hypothetical protein